MAAQCLDCGSWWPEKCGCTELQKQHNITNHHKNNLHQHELAARKALNEHYPYQAPACDYHQQMLQDLSRQVRDQDRTQKPSMTSSPNIFAQGITTETALLPLCLGCANKEGAIAILDHGRIATIDFCVCASNVTMATCWFCELASIKAYKDLALKQRATALKGPGGINILACGRCGIPVQNQDLARQCAGCNGVKTAPYVNFSDEVLDFFPGTAMLRATGQRLESQLILPNFAAFAQKQQQLVPLAARKIIAGVDTRKRKISASGGGDIQGRPYTETPDGDAYHSHVGPESRGDDDHDSDDGLGGIGQKIRQQLGSFLHNKDLTAVVHIDPAMLTKSNGTYGNAGNAGEVVFDRPLPFTSDRQSTG